MQLIHRVQPTSDEYPPWVGIEFIEPVDSDVLAEQLKERYPECRTLRERKHMAAIDFLKDELDRMQKKNSPLTTSTENAMEISIPRIPRPGSAFEEANAGSSRQQSASTCQSPDSSLQMSVLVDHSKQNMERSPSVDNPPLSSASISTGQHFVFSALDGQARQPKTKRKMTTEERSAYKETRKRGACLKCRRQKGRCTHNVDPSTEPSSPEDARNRTKRRTSASPNLDQLETTKIFKFNHTSDIRQASPSEPQPQIHRHVEMDTSARFEQKSVPGQTGAVPGDGQRGGTVTWDSSAMYVSNAPMEPYGLSPSTSQQPEWTGYPPATGGDSLIPGFPEQSSHPGVVYQSTSPSQGSNMYIFDSGYQFEPTWSNPQAPQTENDDPP